MNSPTRSLRRPLLLAAALLPLLGFAAGADDARDAVKDLTVKPTGADGKNSWPMFGGTPSRNMVNPFDTHIPSSWSVAGGNRKNIKWVVDLGTHSFGGPVIACGKVFVGTNNGKPRDPKIVGEKGVLMCFRESDGKFLWQAVHDKLDGDKHYYFPQRGIASTPCVDGDCLYYLSNRCELVCAAVEGDKAGKARILWTLDMIKELKVNPAYLACPALIMAFSSPLAVGDLVFVHTGHGVDYQTRKLLDFDVPSFLAVHKKTGKVAWQDKSPGKNIMDGQWSSPVAAEVRGVTQVIFPGGDGWLYAFEAKTGKLLWKFDCNPKKSVYRAKGRGDRNFFIATPVVHDNKLYIGVGDDPESSPGVGHLWCVDITKEPKGKDKDLSPVDDNFDPKVDVNKDSGLVWHYGGPFNPKPKKGRGYVFGRTMSTVAVHDGLVYAAELDGFLHCLDAKTGEAYWVHDMKDGTWASPYYADGKIYIGTEGGDVLVFEHGKVKKAPTKIDMEKNLQLPVVVANGVLYVNTGTQLYAIAAPNR